MADNIVIGFGNGVQLFQRKAIIDIARANDHSVTALFSLHIQKFTYLYQLAIVQYGASALLAPTRHVFMKHPSGKSHCTLYVIYCLTERVYMS